MGYERGRDSRLRLRVASYPRSIELRLGFSPVFSLTCFYEQLLNLGYQTMDADQGTQPEVFGQAGENSARSTQSTGASVGR